MRSVWLTTSLCVAAVADQRGVGTFSLLNNSSGRKVLLAIFIGCALIGAGILLPAVGLR